MSKDKRSRFGITSGAVLLGVVSVLLPFGGEAVAEKSGCDVPPRMGPENNGRQETVRAGAAREYGCHCLGCRVL